MVPMILTVTGNVVFGAMVFAYYQYTQGTGQFVPGLVFAAGSLFCGLVLGVIGSTPTSRKLARSAKLKSSPATKADWDLSNIVE